MCENENQFTSISYRFSDVYNRSSDSITFNSSPDAKYNRSSDSITFNSSPDAKYQFV